MLRFLNNDLENPSATWKFYTRVANLIPISFVNLRPIPVERIGRGMLVDSYITTGGSGSLKTNDLERFFKVLWIIRWGHKLWPEKYFDYRYINIKEVSFLSWLRFIFFLVEENIEHSPVNCLGSFCWYIPSLRLRRNWQSPAHLGYPFLCVTLLSLWRNQHWTSPDKKVIWILLIIYHLKWRSEGILLGVRMENIHKTSNCFQSLCDYLTNSVFKRQFYKIPTFVLAFKYGRCTVYISL